MAGQEHASRGDACQELFDSIFRGAEISQKPVALLQSLQAGDVESIDLERLLQLLFDLNDASQKSAALATQMISTQSVPAYLQSPAHLANATAPGAVTEATAAVAAAAAAGLFERSPQPYGAAASAGVPERVPQPYSSPAAAPPVSRQPEQPLIVLQPAGPSSSASLSAAASGTAAAAGCVQSVLSAVHLHRQSMSSTSGSAQPATPRASTGSSLMADSLQEGEPVQVLIASSAHDNYLQTKPAGHVVFANLTVPPGCNLHVWKLHRLMGSSGERRVAIQNVGNGMYLCAEPGGHLLCNRTVVREWEEWSLTRVEVDAAAAAAAAPAAAGGSAPWALRSCHGQYLCVEALGCPRWPLPWLETNACKAIANRPECNVWEQFVLVPAPAGSCFVSDAPAA